MPPPAYAPPLAGSGFGWLPAATMAAGLLAASPFGRRTGRSSSKRRAPLKSIRAPSRGGQVKTPTQRSGRYGKRRRVKRSNKLKRRVKRKIMKAVTATGYEKLNTRYLQFFNINNAGNDAVPAVGFSTQKTNRCQWYAFPTMGMAFLDQVLKTGDNQASAADVGWDDQVLITRIRTVMKLKSAHTTPSEITVYFCYPRKNIRTEQLGCVNWNPAMLCTEANYQSAPDQTVARDMNMYDATPFDQPGFCSQFRIKQKYHKCLAPGEEIQIKSLGIGRKKGPKMLVKRKYLDTYNSTFASDYQMIKGYGPLILVRARGCLAHDELKVQDNTSGGVLVLDNTSLNCHYTGFNIDGAIHMDYQCVPALNANITSAIGNAGAYPQSAVLQANSSAFEQPAAAEVTSGV